MKYIILTLDNPEREHYRQTIRETMRGHEEIKSRMINGKDSADLNDAITKWGFDIKFNEWRPGEGGVWFSNIYAWEAIATQSQDVVVFEDDAIIRPGFQEALKLRTPPSYDFLTYYIPYRDPWQVMPVNKFVPTFQQHGNVCIRYSPAGARRILKRLEKTGLDYPVDIWLFKQVLEFRNLRGYSPESRAKVLVDVDFDVPSNIHHDDRISVYKPGEQE